MDGKHMIIGMVLRVITIRLAIARRGVVDLTTYRCPLTEDIASATGLLPDTWNCGLRMRRECRERFPRHLLQRKPLINDPGMHHGTCVTHVPWCMPGSLIHGGGENVPGIPAACTTHNCAYLARGPWRGYPPRATTPMQIDVFAICYM